jgi:hypothetical protein
MGFDPTPYSNDRDRTSQTSKPQQGDLKVLMAQATAFFPNQTLPPGTPDVYLLAWRQIADKYGMSRFQNALWNVLRRSEFFPVPKLIEDECEAIRRISYGGRKDELDAYRREIVQHPERFFNVGEMMKEVMERVARRKVERGQA